MEIDGRGLPWSRLAVAALVALASACGAREAARDGEAAHDAGRDLSPADHERPVMDAGPRSGCEAPVAGRDGDVGTGTPAADADAGADGETVPADDGKDGAGAARWVTGYYAAYQHRRLPPAAVPYGALTHLVVTRVVPLADGTLDTSFDAGPEDGPALADELTRRATEAGVRPLLMVGGGGAREALAAATEDDVRGALVRRLVDFARLHGFDGLDIDWEPFLEGDHRGFRALAEDLRAAWPGMILTAPIGCFDADRGTVPDVYAEAAPLFDQLNVMSYGMAWDIPGWRSWHTSALRGAGEGTPTSIDGTVRRYLGAGVPAAKLGIGVGLFGLCYGPPVDGPRQALRGAKIAARDHDLSWALVMARYFDPAARRWDEEAQAPYLSFAAPKARFGCTYVSYEDAESIAARAAYVAELGLGGVIVWTINEGHVATAPEGERDPMVEALAEHLLGR